MKNNITTVIAVLFLVVVASVFYITSQDSQNSNHSNDVTVNEESVSHMDMMQQMFVTSEKEFIEKMIPHHQEAIDTAAEVLERGGTTDEIRELMNTIVVAQTKEVASMKEWYEVWFGASYQDDGEYKPMMRELANLSGVDIDRAFLQDMIMHHMGAIMMARSIQPHVEHTEMTELTKAIVTTQSEEIVLMRKLLETL